MTNNPNGWIPVKTALPKKNGRYLVAKRTYGDTYVDILCFAKNLYKVDKYDFPGTNNKRPGWYWYDSEYGCIDATDLVTAWQELPEPYKENDDDNKTDR